jgi:5-methylcytosine-specific restriction enzyme subunit McrC
VNPLTIVQYQPTEPVELPAAVLQSLVTNYANRIDIQPAGSGSVILKGTNHIGLIHADQLDIVIRPKIPAMSVFWMLGFADRLVSFEPVEFPFDEETGLLDLLARLFAKQAEQMIRRGLYREYVERQDNLRFIRGRLMPLDDLTTNRGLRHQVVCRFTELTADVPHNQVLRAVTEQLLQFTYRLPGIREQLAWNSAHLAEVGRTPVTERDIAALRYGRLNGHYRGVHALARLVIRHFTFDFQAGERPAPSFLVDMDKVFEEYVRQLVSEQARMYGLRLRSSTGLRLDRDGQVPIDPDIVLSDGKRVRAAIDAKYKRESQQADVYQALAYAKGLGLSRVALVYPSDGDVAPESHRIRHDETEVLVRTLPVSHGGRGFPVLEKRAASAAAAILGELLPPVAAAAA